MTDWKQRNAPVALLRRPIFAFILALAGVTLTALVSIAVINAGRISLSVSAVQVSVRKMESLAGYPIEARYDRRTANIVVQGLVPDAAAAGLLETSLQQRHPRQSLHFVLSNISTDAVRPNLRSARVEREANSASVAALRETGMLRDAVIMDLKQQITVLRAELQGFRAQAAAATYPAVTYDLDPYLAAARDRVGGLLVGGTLLDVLRTPAEAGFEMLSPEAPEAPEAPAAMAPEVGPISKNAEQTIAALLVGFTEELRFTDIRLANDVAEALTLILEQQHADARIQLLTMARPIGDRPAPAHTAFFMASKMRALLIAKGISPSRIDLRYGGRSAPVSALESRDWRKSHYLGFRLDFTPSSLPL